MRKLMRASILSFLTFFSFILLAILQILRERGDRVLWDGLTVVLVTLLLLSIVFGIASILEDE